MADSELSDLQKEILEGKGTERPHSGALLHNEITGNYDCAKCGAPLFNSDAKYDSTVPGLIGWPSFDTAIEGAIKEVADDGLFMKRTETLCANCGSHLGHVFAADDAPTGVHYCINSAALNFTSEDGKTKIRGDGE